jgi:hypothetical protein
MATIVALDKLLGLKGKEKLVNGFFDIPDPAFPLKSSLFRNLVIRARRNESIDG